MVEVKNSTLFFSPFSAIQKHREVELLLALRMKRRGESPTFLTCRGLFDSFCVAMSASGFTENSISLELKSVCRICTNIGNMTHSIFGFSNLYAENYLKGFTRSNVDLILESLNSKNWIYFEYKGVPIGKFAAYEFFLNHKLNSIDIPEHLWGAFLKHLKNCILAVEISLNYFMKNRHERVFVYNRLYSINRIFCYVAELNGIETYSIQGAGPIRRYYSRISLYRDDQDIFKLVRSSNWNTYSGSRLSVMHAWRATSHLRHLLIARSPWVYSTPGGKLSNEELRNNLGIKPSQKVFLLTTSSQDELLAASLAGVFTAPSKQLLFDTSMHWIEFVVEQVRKNPDWFLIIRPHPREFPNKREGVSSESGAQLISFLKKFDPISNVFINHPNQNISIYDLAKITTVHLNSTSTVGLEMTLLGVPCLINNKASLTGYPPEINYEAKTRDEYLELMNSLTREIPVEFTRLALNWITFKYTKSTLKYRYLHNVTLYVIGNLIRRMDNRKIRIPGVNKFSETLFRVISVNANSKISVNFALGVEDSNLKSEMFNGGRFLEPFVILLFRTMSWRFR